MKELRDLFAWVRRSRKRVLVAVIILVVLVFSGFRLLVRGGMEVQYQTATVQKGTTVTSGVLPAIIAGNYLYASIWLMAAALPQSLVKNHPFKDGDKRTAYFSTVRFLRTKPLRKFPLG